MDSPSILIIDDILANLQLLQGVLRDKGYVVRPVTTGQKALQIARAQPPDLILLDINMPDMDGYEICSLLKAEETLREIPVLFLTVSLDVASKVRAFAVGGVDYITKPFILEEVEARIATHLTMGRQQKELRRQKEELQNNYNKLRELERVKDDLVDMIVHDMRNILQGTSAYHSFLRREIASPRAQEYLGKAERSNDDLIYMVNSLLDISRMEAGRFNANMVRCEFYPMLEHAMQQIAGMQGGRDIILDIPDQPVNVTCDPGIMSRILLNLLHNAVKFTPDDGRIIVGIQKLDGLMRISVRDNGPGIPPEYHERIFEKFGRLELRHTHKYPSTGLGLTFCKLAVEVQGGTMGVNSDEGQGAEFWFAIPEGVVQTS